MAMAARAFVEFIALYHAGYKVANTSVWRGSLKIAKKPIMKRSKNLLKMHEEMHNVIPVALFLWGVDSAYKELNHG